MNFILIQVIGIIAWLFLVISFYGKNTNRIILFQIISTLLYGIHYYLLHAYAGLIVCIVEMIFDFGYYLSNNDKYIYVASIPIRIISGLFGYKKGIDVLPIVASLVDGYNLTRKRDKLILGSIFTYLLWIIYDIFVLSYSGIVTSGILVISNIYIILKRKITNKLNIS